MTSLEGHRILVLGWPIEPQDWLKDYSCATASRIYREKISPMEKRLKDLSFHTPKALWRIQALSPMHWYESWKHSVEAFDTVILINELRGRDIFEYILKKNPACRICVFYDAPISPEGKNSPVQYTDLPIHFFTCDPKIASLYHITFAPYFYIFSPYPFDMYGKTASPPADYDVFFVGEEKGDRSEQLAHIRELLKESGLTHDFHLIPQKRHGNSRAKASYMPYDTVVSHIQKSRAILELISDGQSGLTQRPYEALFFGKKLITTSREILRYDFYRSENVFILGNRPIDELPLFLKTPFRPVEKEIIEQYDFPHWLMRFIE